MPRWLPRILARIREFARSRRVEITNKARREMELLELAMDREDLCDLLADLEGDDFVRRFSSVATGEWMYVFKPQVAHLVIYLKLILRDDCVVISCHEDSDDDDQDDDA